MREAWVWRGQPSDNNMQRRSGAGETRQAGRCHLVEEVPHRRLPFLATLRLVHGKELDVAQRQRLLLRDLGIVEIEA